MLRFMLFVLVVVAACAPQGPKSVTPVPSESPRPPQLSARAETPTHLVLRGRAGGGAGPDLHVEIKRVDTSRVEYSVTIVDSAAEIHHAVVERAAANDVRVISRGGDGVRGADGASGRDGMSGTPGTSAMCPSIAAGDGGRGEDGTRGEDGETGGAGGRGGNIVVDVVGGVHDEALVALARRIELSEGGSGGDGGIAGAGGRGGSGGLAGSGATCVDAAGAVSMLPGGSSGYSGLDGPSGFLGRSGPTGAAGRVTVRVVE